MIEGLSSLIRRSTVEKNCQKRVNTRENASRDRSVCLYQQTCAHPQSIVLSRSFPCCSFSLQEVSQTCSQLIHMPFKAALASGLETRNQLRKRQEKNEFNFRLRQKNFLDCKNEASVSKQNGKERTRENFRASRMPIDSESSRQTDLAARLCAASAELTGLACAGNFPPLRAEGNA
jgi:hypothetical protein